MTDVICGFCRGESTAGCEYCRPRPQPQHTDTVPWVISMRLASVQGANQCFHCAVKDKRIEELEEKLELWCEYYFNGLPPDEVRDLYVDTLHSQENDDGTIQER